jgi:hypothetical protein
MPFAANVTFGDDLQWHAVDWKSVYRIVKNVFINPQARVSRVDKRGPFWYTHGVLIRVGSYQNGRSRILSEQCE